MRKAVVIIGLVLAAVLVPWQLGYDPSIFAASTDYTIGWTAMAPAPVVAGNEAKTDTRAGARQRDVTVEAKVKNAGGQAVWTKSWPNERLNVWQNNYAAAWPVPSTQAAGAYTLVVSVLPAGGATVAAAGTPAPKTATFTVVRAATSSELPTATPRASTPAPTATPRTGAPAPTATPVPAGEHPFAITGSAVYVAKMKAAAACSRRARRRNMPSRPSNVRQIREEGGSVAYVASGVIAVSTGSALFTVNWAASQIVHEANHVKNYREGRTYYGCQGEANSLRPQAAFLRSIGDAGTAAYVEGMIGVWAAQ